MKIGKGIEMGIFSEKFDAKDIREAEGFSRTPNMNTPGWYVVRILKHTIAKSQKNKNEIKFVCDYEILETADPKVHPVQCRRAYVVTINPNDTAKAKSKLAAVKLHISQVAGVDQSEVDGPYLDKLENSPMMFEGTIMKLEVLPQIDLDTKGAVTSSTNRIFTPQNWYSFEGDWSPPTEPTYSEEEQVVF